MIKSEIIRIYIYIKSDQFYTILYFFHPLVLIMSLSMKNEFIRSSFLQKSRLKITEISALEVHYFKVSTKESLSSRKKNIDSLFVLTLK